jgi:hypothetical protein
MLTRTLIAAAALFCLGSAGRANAILFTVEENNQAGVPFEATATHPGFTLPERSRPHLTIQGLSTLQIPNRRISTVQGI